jgi:predicted GIY-YIG superfamily endonuclease
MYSDEAIRSIADFRRLRAVLAELHNGIDRARREFGDEVIVHYAKLENVSDALARSERITKYLRNLQQQVLEKRAEEKSGKTA